MANSTTNLDTVSASQASKEVTANALFDAASPATLFGRRASTTTALTWGYYGGRMLVDGVLTAIANGTVALTASTTNYVEATRAGVVSKNTTGFTAGQIPLYTIVTGASAVTSYTDERDWVTPYYITHEVAITVTTADVTLTAAQARAEYIQASGTLTGNRNVIVPNHGKWEIYNGCAGAFTLTVKTSAGTGIVIAAGDRALLRADGTNVVLIANSIGTTTPSTGTFTSLTDSGNLTFTGTGNRITGDFSDATVANRVMFQTSTVNGNTDINAIPNGTGVQSQFSIHNNSDPTNSARTTILINSTETSLRANILGTGTYLPMTFHTGGSERMRIDASGQVEFSGADTGARLVTITGGTTNYGGLYIRNNGTNVNPNYIFFGDAGGERIRLYQGAGGDFNIGNPLGQGLNISPAGNTVHNHANGGLGYGTGAGGTVTQATSKATGVTLSKPTGQITLNGASLAAATIVSFTLTNTLIAATDTLVINHQSVGTLGAYTINAACAAGSATISIRNNTAGALAEAIVLNFNLVKGVTA